MKWWLFELKRETGRFLASSKGVSWHDALKNLKDDDAVWSSPNVYVIGSVDLCQGATRAIWFDAGTQGSTK